jgi:hypothetical protein
MKDEAGTAMAFQGKAKVVLLVKERSSFPSRHMVCVDSHEL